jgi:cob(I)alamin adenosyltransferase
MKIYTKTGDDGETGLWGGLRVSKDTIRVQAYGTVDECNAAIGVVRAAGVAAELDAILMTVQKPTIRGRSRFGNPRSSRQNPTRE